jgi:hypothetical protein
MVIKVCLTLACAMKFEVKVQYLGLIRSTGVRVRIWRRLG